MIQDSGFENSEFRIHTVYKMADFHKLADVNSKNNLHVTCYYPCASYVVSWRDATGSDRVARVSMNFRTTSSPSTVIVIAFIVLPFSHRTLFSTHGATTLPFPFVLLAFGVSCNLQRICIAFHCKSCCLSCSFYKLIINIWISVLNASYFFLLFSPTRTPEFMLRTSEKSDRVD